MIVKMNDMEIEFKRLHENARIPQKAYNDDYGFDCVAATEEEISPGVWRYGLGFALQIDDRMKSEWIIHKIAVYPRSSIYKTGMVMSNSVGIVDESYTGEISAIFYHVMPNLPRYRVGDKICQIAVELRPGRQSFKPVDEIRETDRGSNGYGSTGLKGM